MLMKWMTLVPVMITFAGYNFCGPTKAAIRTFEITSGDSAEKLHFVPGLRRMTDMYYGNRII
jgi:hypothetical protein